jgi:hypothetical protein
MSTRNIAIIAHGAIEADITEFVLNAGTISNPDIDSLITITGFPGTYLTYEAFIQLFQFCQLILRDSTEELSYAFPPYKFPETILKSGEKINAVINPQRDNANDLVKLFLGQLVCLNDSHPDIYLDIPQNGMFLQKIIRKQIIDNTLPTVPIEAFTIHTLLNGSQFLNFSLNSAYEGDQQHIKDAIGIWEFDETRSVKILEVQPELLSKTIDRIHQSNAPGQKLRLFLFCCGRFEYKLFDDITVAWKGLVQPYINASEKFSEEVEMKDGEVAVKLAIYNNDTILSKLIKYYKKKYVSFLSTYGGDMRKHFETLEAIKHVTEISATLGGSRLTIKKKKHIKKKYKKQSRKIKH